MTEGKCAIWGTPATITNDGGPPEYDSPRAGGRYKIGTGHINEIENLSDEIKSKLTTWLVDKRISGTICPEVESYSDFLERIKAKPLLSTSERIDRYFRYCSHAKIRPGLGVYYFSKSKGGRSNIDLQNQEIYAWTETINFKEFNFFRQVLKELGLISAYVELAGAPDFDMLTAAGFARLDEFERGNNSKQAFVAMWFDPDDRSIFEKGIKPAIEFDPYNKETGFKAFRVDREHHTDFIMDFMIGNIKRSKFMVADFTSFMIKGHKITDGTALSAEIKDFQIARGGVYYEAGYAMGLGIPVIATCRKNQIDHIHFDLKQFNTIYWEDAADLRKQLSERIFAMFVT